jgi:hypothetical protein
MEELMMEVSFRALTMHKYSFTSLSKKIKIALTVKINSFQKDIVIHTFSRFHNWGLE